MFDSSPSERAIQRIQAFAESAVKNNPEGYFVAYSGGKDSCVLLDLVRRAGVPHKAYFSVTTVDPPELLRFIRATEPGVVWLKPKTSMFKLIPEHSMPPTRIVRYCCDHLKERGGEGRIVLTGIRAAESAKRKRSWKLVQQCTKKGKFIINPLLDWQEHDVWDYLNAHKLPVCSLYSEGYRRIGCVGCPMSDRQASHMERWPRFKAAYLKAFAKMLVRRRERGLKTTWQTAEEVMDWWLDVNQRTDEIGPMFDEAEPYDEESDE